MKNKRCPFNFDFSWTHLERTGKCMNLICRLFAVYYSTQRALINPKFANSHGKQVVVSHRLSSHHEIFTV